MKVFLIASFALLSLAFAHPHHDHHHGHVHDHHAHGDDAHHPLNHDPHPNHPAYKFIFDKGLVISESINIKKIDVELKGGDVLVFTVVHDASTPDDVMEIARGAAKWEDLQFVIEGLDYHDSEHEHDHPCDDSPLKHLIKACHGHMHLRDPHDDEKKQAADLGAALAAEAPKRIKVYYHHDHMVSLHKLNVIELKIEKTNPKTLVVQTLQDPPTNIKIVVESPTKIENESFTVVAVKPPPYICMVDVDIVHLIKACEGDIFFRKLNAGELAHVLFL